MIKRFITQYPILFVVMVITFIIRLYAGYVQSFSNDELSALYRLQFNNFHDLIHWGVKVDGHPALVQLFLYYYMAIVPKSEFFIRLPFIIAGTLSFVYIFGCIKKLAGEFSAHMVVIILAFSGFSLQLGYFARPYAFGILFSSAAAYYWIRIFIDKSPRKKYLVWFTLFAILAAYTHYFSLLEIVALGMATFIFAPWKLWWKMILTGTIAFVAYLPNYPVLKFQLSVGGIGGWLGKPKDYFIIDLLFEYFDRSALILGACCLISMIMIVKHASRTNFKNTALLFFLSMVPFTMLYFYSVKVNSVLQFSACYFLMPFLLGGLFSFFETKAGSKWTITWGYPLVAIIFLHSTLFANNAFAPIHFAEFKRIAQYIEEHESEGTTTVVAVNNPFYIDWYLKDQKPDLYITDMGDDLNFLRRYIDTCKNENFIYAFANQRSNGEIPFMIQNRYQNVAEMYKYMNSELYHLNQPSGFRTQTGFEPLYHFTYKTSTNTFEENFYSYFQKFHMDSTMEFSPAFEIELNKLKLHVYDQVVISARFPMYEDCDAELVLTVEENEKTTFWRSRKYAHHYEFHRDTTQKPTQMIYQTSISWTPCTFAGIAENLNNEGIDLKKGRLKAYIWNPRHKNYWVEAFTVAFYRGNPYTSGYSQ